MGFFGGGRNYTRELEEACRHRQVVEFVEKMEREGFGEWQEEDRGDASFLCYPTNTMFVRLTRKGRDCEIDEREYNYTRDWAKRNYIIR